MRFLKRWARRAAAVLPPPVPPEPRRLPALPDGTNPIQRWLGDLGLPWREPREEVEVRLGMRPDPFYGWEIVSFDAAARLPGFMAPWETRVFEQYPPDLPIARFGGLVWFEDDAHANLRRTAATLAERFGPAAAGQEYNTLVCEWRAGTASIRLVAWPPEWQSGLPSNPAHGHEPRLATACHVNLLTGFRLPLSEREAAWAASFRGIAPAVPTMRVAMDRLRDAAPSETELEYARDPAEYLPTVFGKIGTSAHGEALIACTHQLFVVPRGAVLGFEAIRLLPAKGGGGSTLRVRCRTSCPGVPHKSITLAHHDEPDGMNELAHRLGARFDRPVEIGPYFDDV